MGKGARARAQRRQRGDAAFGAHMNQPGGLRDRPTKERGAFLAIAQYAMDNPEMAARVEALEPEVISALAMEIAFPERYGRSVDGCLDNAGTIWAWAMLTGNVDFFGWPRSLITMSVDDIINAIRVDRAEGRMGPPLAVHPVEPFDLPDAPESGA